MNFLTDSTIVYSKEYNEFYCFICTGDSIVVNYAEHNENPRHLEALKQFKLIFSEDNGKIHCKLCNSDLHWSNVKTHGKSHLIVPWYKLEEKFENFVKNRIIACKAQYYCCPCEMIFLEWSAALNHTTDPEHCNLNEKLPSIDKILPRLIHGVNHELLVREGIALIDSNLLTCKICGDEIIEMTNVLEHIEATRHRYNSHKFDEISLKKEYIVPIIKDKKQSVLSDKSFSEETNNFFDPSYDCIVEENAIYSRCMICEKIFFTEQTKNHLDEKVHEIAKERLGFEALTSNGKKEYNCEYCVCTVFGTSNLYRHVKGKRHDAAISKNRTLTPNPKDKTEQLEKIVIKPRKKSRKSRKARRNAKKQENMEIPRQLEKLETKEEEKNHVRDQSAKKTDDYCIAKQNAENWSCKICRAYFSCYREIENHRMKTEHVKSMKKYGCEKITLIEKNLYKCDCCECEITGKESVTDHIMGKRHSARLSGIKKPQKVNSEKTVVKNTPESATILPTVLTTNIAKLYEHLRKSNIKRMNKGNNSRGTSQQNIAKMRNIRCNICNIEVAGSADLHSHLANHLSVEFVNEKIDKNANIQCSIMEHDANKSENGICVPERKTCSVTDGISSVSANDDNDNCTRIEYPPSIDFGHVTSDTESDTEALISTKKSIVRADHLSFGKDYIYDIRERFRAIELGTKLCFVNDKDTIYCLVCHKNVTNKLQCYFDHLSSLDHTTNLQAMEQDDTLFDGFVGQLSELKLAHEYMEEKSDRLVECLICNDEIINNDDCLQRHIDDKSHEMIREAMARCSRQNFDRIKARMQCDWYNVQKYWCVPCSEHFLSEGEFAKHLENPRHDSSTTEIADIDKKLIYDFCPTCGLLWYGYRTTYAYHCLLSSHKWLLRDGHYALFDLPQLAKILLANTENYVESTLDKIREESASEREKEKTLLKQLVKTAKTKFERVTAYKFGSRVCGVATCESDVNVFLDCGGMYEGPSKSKNSKKRMIMSVQECLSNDPLSWDAIELSKNRRDSIINALHIETNRSCNIFLENGLPVETTHLLRSIMKKCPLCQRMIIFLRQWLAVCDLSGCDGISNYAMYWYVVFYLQKESILPCIDDLKATKKKSRVIAGWRVSVSQNFTCGKGESDYSLKESLIRFFTYYANFNYRYDVACPLIGEVTKKRFFADLKKLPREMAPYVTYANNYPRGEPFDINSPMCIQDPFDLHQNLTKTVTKIYLSRFRNYCSKSLDVLCSS